MSCSSCPLTYFGLNMNGCVWDTDIGWKGLRTTALDEAHESIQAYLWLEICIVALLVDQSTSEWSLEWVSILKCPSAHVVFPVDVVLDPDTAHPNIVLSADGKQAGRGELLHIVPDNPQRFDPVICVVSKKGFLSGRFYFQVRVFFFFFFWWW